MMSVAVVTTGARNLHMPPKPSDRLRWLTLRMSHASAQLSARRLHAFAGRHVDRTADDDSRRPTA